jgi:hypothetical protein
MNNIDKLKRFYTKITQLVCLKGGTLTLTVLTYQYEDAMQNQVVRVIIHGVFTI